MSNKRAVIKTADGTTVTLDGYSVDDVRWLIRVSGNTPQPPAPQPEPNPNQLATHRPARAAKVLKVKLPSLRVGDHIESRAEKSSYYMVDMGQGRMKKIPFQVKGLFQCAFCDAVLTSPAARGGHERPHVERGDPQKRTVIALPPTPADAAEGLSEPKNAV